MFVNVKENKILFIKSLFYKYLRIFINRLFSLKFIADMDIQSFILNWSLHEYFLH